MRKSRGVFMLTFLLVLSLTLGGMAPVTQAKKKVVRYSDPIVLYVGQSHKIRNNGNKKKARWVSGKKSVVTVTQKGKLTAKKVGKTTVTMKIYSSKYIFKVEVLRRPVKKGTVNLMLGAKKTLKPGVKGKVTWKSADSRIASVTKSGKVTAKKVGKVRVTATTKVKEYQYMIAVYAPDADDNAGTGTVSTAKTKKYSYKVSLWNTDNGVYNGCPYGLFIETDNPDPKGFEIRSTDISRYVPVANYTDIPAQGTVDAGAVMVRVSGGYLCIVEFDTPGDKTISIYEKQDGEPLLGINYHTTIQDYQAAETAWYQRQIDTNKDNLTDDMTQEEKVELFRKLVDQVFTVVEQVDDTKLKQTGPYWITKVVDAAQKEAIVKRFEGMVK